MDEKLFALDIGTRSVVGIILELQHDRYRVIDMVSEEHGERSMLDGQIHNILDVSYVIQKVKQQLEEKHGPLTKVCVAAAGRALKTMKSTYETNIYEQPLMTYEDILHLELSAVQQAQYALAEGDQQVENYYCVGYSVLHYYLDDDEIGSLLDQQGEQARVDIIATFLPKVVVDSLLSALKRAGLDMEALTLEPIAAIQVLIPQSMRRLNVALVDIGAGTSDIALTSEGTVTAYGMVPKAGDEITEAMSEQFLLDFHRAEEAKRNLVQQDSIQIEDILGFKSELSKKEVVQSVEYAIDALAKAICEQILSLNQKAPKAVMLVGGGSLTPALPEKVADYLNLPTNRVAIRGIDAIQVLDEKEELPDSPEYVTPIGIAIAAKQNPIHYISVEVNNRTVRLFDLKQLTIGDSLLAAGIQMNKLYGKPGMAIMVGLNGRKVTLPGTLGEAPTIKINGEEASVKDDIKHQDVIEVEKGVDGETPVYTVKDVIGDVPEQSIFINEKQYTVKPAVQVNQETVNLNYQLSDGDSIHWEHQLTIEKALIQCGLDIYLDQSKPFTILYNHKDLKITDQIVTIKKQDKLLSLTDEIHDGDQLTITMTDSMTLKDLTEHLAIKDQEDITVFYNQKPLTLTKESHLFYRNGEKANENTLIYPGDQIISEERQQDPFIFQDIFRVIEMDLDEMKGSRFKLYKNGDEAGFVTEIFDGDQLAIDWDSHKTLS
ncbi:cell division protein FtsA [Tenuibacillus multivorans]|uniref:Cell division protein FtsA n=1 Tax=Tenuibacillus multivorans TaxID=237069 RepID=A0A1H0EEQ4_9BACI|nr:cell division protein FtsA [Tenuibacillus multivorans]GEL77184.1 ATPase [Tenuibacillus multivorans]SDN80977.1 cell division protein FtsA [Tenuibacillus multivorans]